MNGWLLDTHVLSKLRRKKPSPAVVDFVSVQPLDRLFVSEVTFAEIQFGIDLPYPSGPRRLERVQESHIEIRRAPRNSRWRIARGWWSSTKCNRHP